MHIVQYGSLPPVAGGRTSGGVATHLWELCLNLTGRGHSVTAIGENLQSVRPSVVQSVTTLGMPHRNRALSDLLLPSPTRLFRALKRAPAAGRYLECGWRGRLYWCYHFGRLKRPDVVHAHYRDHLHIFKALFPDTPLVLTVHSWHALMYYPDPQRHLEVARAALSLADRVILVAEGLREQAEGFGLKLPAATEVIHNPLDFSPSRLSGEEAKKRLGIEGPMVLFVGALVGRKGEELALQALALMETKVRPLIVFLGGGERLEETRALATRLGVGARFGGVVTRGVVADHLAACSLLLLPSKNESYPLSIIEAYCAGRPVVVLNDTVALARSSLLPDSSFGRAVDDAPEAVAGAVLSVMNRSTDEEKLKRYGESHSWKGSTGRFEELYSRAAPLPDVG